MEATLGYRRIRGAEGQTVGPEAVTVSGGPGGETASARARLGGPARLPEVVDPLEVPLIAESAEAVIEGLDAPLAAGPALVEGLRDIDGRGEASTIARGSVVDGDVSEDRPIAVDEYAKAVLYNSLGHYEAARTAAQRACAHDGFLLLEGSLAELVEASVRSGSPGPALVAMGRLSALVDGSGSRWAMGVAACSRALISADECAESSYLEAIDLLAGTSARVALGRTRLVYGEWLRRQGRRVDAREQLTLACSVFNEVGLDGFAERARRELLATGATVRKRTDDTRLDLTPQETEIAQLAAVGYTNPEIGQRLFISPRTVEWHLRKVFTKLGAASRRELPGILSRESPVAVAV